MWTNAMAMENNANFPREKNTKKLDLTSLLYVFVDSWRSRVACSFLQIIIIIYYFVLGLKSFNLYDYTYHRPTPDFFPAMKSLHYWEDIFHSWFIWGWLQVSAACFIDGLKARCLASKWGDWANECCCFLGVNVLWSIFERQNTHIS